MRSPIVPATLFAVALAVAPTVAMSQTTNQTVTITRTAGTCPRSVAVTVVTKQYPGGFTLDYTARTMVPAYSAELLAATPQRIVFDAPLRESYASCEGTGKARGLSFTLHKGTLTFVLTPGKGPNNTYPGLNELDVHNGVPHANMSVTD
jgi:hypothetical protein